MKKGTLLIVSMLSVIALVLGMCGCGALASPEDKLKNYIDSESFQSELQEIKDSYKDMMDVDVSAEDNKLIYVYKYTTQFDDSTLETVKSQLESSKDSFASVFEGIADELKSSLGIEDPKVVLKYENADGTLITEFEYGTSEN